VLHSKCVTIPLQLTEKLVWSGSIADERHLTLQTLETSRTVAPLTLDQHIGVRIPGGQAD